MDFVTRQFIVLTKKLREDVRKALSTIHNDLQKQTDAVSQTAKATQENKQDPLPIPLPVRAELQIPEAVQTEQRTQHNRSHTLQIWLTVGTWLAFLAASIYAGIAALQWCQMKRSTDLAQKANADAWTLADRANKTAVDAERPWVGMTFLIQNWTDDKTRKAIVFFTNSGRRPAKATLVQLGKNTFSIFPVNPRYEKFRTDVNSVALIVPNSVVSNAVPLPELTQDRLNTLAARKQTFFIYSNIEYEDVLNHAKHWTHACWQYFPGFENGAYGFVNCASYNEVDPEPAEKH